LLINSLGITRAWAHGHGLKKKWIDFCDFCQSLIANKFRSCMISLKNGRRCSPPNKIDHLNGSKT